MAMKKKEKFSKIRSTFFLLKDKVFLRKVNYFVYCYFCLIIFDLFFFVIFVFFFYHKSLKSLFNKKFLAYPAPRG